MTYEEALKYWKDNLKDMQETIESHPIEFQHGIKVKKVLEIGIEAIEKQVPKRVKAKSKKDFTIDDFKGVRDTRYYCPCCNKSVKHYTKCCDNCGQRLIFPQVRCSEYIEGVEQNRWLEWEEE